MYNAATTTTAERKTESRQQARIPKLVGIQYTMCVDVHSAQQAEEPGWKKVGVCYCFDRWKLEIYMNK